MKERLRNRLKTLTAMHGISGFEETVAAYVRDELEKVCDEVVVEPNGNVIGRKKGNRKGPVLTLMAHMDEIGFVVKNVLPNGFLLFDKVGLPSDKVLEGRKVVVDGKYVGVIGIKPGHLTTPEEGKRCNSAKECYIDICCNSREEVKALGIDIGSPVTFQSAFDTMANPDYICTKAIDDRMCLAVMLEVMNDIRDGNFGGTVIAVGSVQEEIGLKGARIVANTVAMDYAIALDTVPAGDTPDINTENELPIRLGNGPACVLGDGVWAAVKISLANKKVAGAIKNACAKHNINLQTTTLLGDLYMTDQFELSAAGIPCAGLSIPRRYSHSPVEIVNLNDALDTVVVLKEIISNNQNIALNFI